MSKKEWSCEFCGKTYLLNNKWNHLQTKILEENMKDI